MTVGVLGEDPLTARVSSLLLSDVGYETPAPDGAVPDAPSTALANVDVVFLEP